MLTNGFRREQQQHFNQLASSYQERDHRWSGKLQASPYKGDLLGPHWKANDYAHVAWPAERRAQSLTSLQEREVHKSVFRRALTDNDELEKLRAEKRALLESERRLKVLRDAEQTNLKIEKLAYMRERERQALEAKKASREDDERRKQDHWRTMMGYSGKRPNPRKCKSLTDLRGTKTGLGPHCQEPEQGAAEPVEW